MSYLAQWIPTLVAVVILAIAALVLELQIRAERRAPTSRRESTHSDTLRGSTPSSRS